VYRFIPRNGFIEMEKEENYPNHYYIYAGISEKIGLGLEINGIVIQNDLYQRNLVCIYSKKKSKKSIGKYSSIFRIITWTFYQENIRRRYWKKDSFFHRREIW
jgi:hypothetical protein